MPSGRSSLAPALLLSMPQLVDPNFNRTVVLLCRHSPRMGALGLVMNRPLLTSGRVVVNLDPPVSTDRQLQLWIGGPVEPERSWILVGDERANPLPADRASAPANGVAVGDESEADDDDDAEQVVGKRIADGLYLSTAPDLLRRTLEEEPPPPRTRLIVGYSGWAPGQLEAELEASAWLMSDVDAELIFTTPPERMWETAIRRLGADPATLQMSRGVH